MSEKYKTNSDSLTSEITKRLFVDGKPPFGSTVISGWVSKSENPDKVKIYLDLTFNKFALVSVDKINGHEHVTNDKYPFGITFLWIDQEAELEIHEITTLKARNSEFSASISKEIIQPYYTTLPDGGHDGPHGGDLLPIPNKPITKV